MDTWSPLPRSLSFAAAAAASFIEPALARLGMRDASRLRRMGRLRRKVLISQKAANTWAKMTMGTHSGTMAVWPAAPT